MNGVMRCKSGWTLAIGLLLNVAAIAAAPPYLSDARRVADEATKDWTVWDGPRRGPVAAEGKHVWFVASDLRNGGVVGVYRGMQEACKLTHWQLTVADGAGDATGRHNALLQAIDAKPDAIALVGFDAGEFPDAIDTAKARHIPIVGWHAADRPGPTATLFTNVSTDAMDTATAAASYVIAHSNGTAGVVLFNDSEFAIANAKTAHIKELILQCSGCRLLAVADIPLAHARDQVPDKVRSLMAALGKDWTDSIGINDLYFDSIGVPMLQARREDINNVSAGDGSFVAMRRIRSGRFQTATIAEPLRLHGWQMVDEINRALAGDPPSGYVTQPHLLTQQTIRESYSSVGYDPDSGYRDIYARIWRGGE